MLDLLKLIGLVKLLKGAIYKVEGDKKQPLIWFPG